MSDQPTLEDVTRILQARMAAAALRHADKVDVRTGTMLERAGLLKREAEGDSDPELVQILGNKNHARRIQTVAGPILIYADAKNPTQRFAVDVKQLLLSVHAQTRTAALHYFADEESSAAEIDLAASTRSVLEQTRAALSDGDPAIWHKSSLEAYDAIDLDLACQLAGLRQSVGAQYEDGLRHYVPKLLKPESKSFDVIGAVFINPSAHKEAAAEALEGLVSERDLCSASASYVESMGTLPLAGELSFMRFLQQWVKAHDEPAGWRKDVLAWATTSTNPLSRFYVAMALLQMPNGATDEELQHIGDLLRELFLESEADDESLHAIKTYWTLQTYLAQHYLRHLETLSAGGLGEPLAMAAWWLASRLAVVLFEFPRALAHLAKVAIQPYKSETERAWRFANPTVEASPASTATHWAQSPWRLAALNVLASNVEHAEVAFSHMPARENFEHAICRQSILGCATTSESNASPIYLFEVNYSQCLNGLRALLKDADRQQIVEVAKSYYDELTNPNVFAAKFAVIADGEEFEHLVIANAARILSLRDLLPLDAVWQKLVDPTWRVKSFGKLSSNALEILFLSFARSLRKGGDIWLAGLPHIYAQAAEELGSDTQKAELLFALAVFSSMHSHSVSAVERLLRGRYRSRFMEYGRLWKNILAQSSKTSPPWVSARIRALSAAISAAQ